MQAQRNRGCAPIVNAFKHNSDEVILSGQRRLLKSLAIDPGDGMYVLKRLKHNGLAEEASDQEIADGIMLLAQTEGIFTEPAGGVSVAVFRKLVEENKIEKDERIVCYVTGNGLKATEAVIGLLPKLNAIKPDAAEVSAIMRG